MSPGLSAWSLAHGTPAARKFLLQLVCSMYFLACLPARFGSVTSRCRSSKASRVELRDVLIRNIAETKEGRSSNGAVCSKVFAVGCVFVVCAVSPATSSTATVLVNTQTSYVRDGSNTAAGNNVRWISWKTDSSLASAGVGSKRASNLKPWIG